MPFFWGEVGHRRVLLIPHPMVGEGIGGVCAHLIPLVVLCKGQHLCRKGGFELQAEIPLITFLVQTVEVSSWITFREPQVRPEVKVIGEDMMLDATVSPSWAFIPSNLRTCYPNQRHIICE